jgi:hypothetical protein
MILFALFLLGVMLSVSALLVAVIGISWSLELKLKQ